MAQRVVTTLTCDYPHRGKEVDATGTVQVAWNGKTYELDVCEQDATRVSRLMEQVTEHARTMSGSGKAQSNGAKPAKPRTNNNSSEVRAWAKSQGIELSGRGRIPNEVAQQFAQSQAS